LAAGGLGGGGATLGRGRGGGGRGGIGGGLGLLGGSGDGRHHEVTVGDGRADAVGALEVGPADIVVDVERAEVGLEMLGHLVGIDVALDRVAHHVEHATALQARAGQLVQEGHGDRHAHLLTGGEALEVDMLRRVGDRVELHIADQRARRRGAGQLHLIQARAPAAALQLAQHGARVQRDKSGRLFGAVDNRRHLACPPGRACCPLTCTLARLGLDRHDIGHGSLLN
jgi:hypothetical protein